ncbi:hypothetical protein [Breoghania sp.]|uniref:hypothetical protein n=1 Tax=Breoghania sp. TaxID=2065378 RepID=UPI002AA7C3E9|nr:hypothetical protein [Breoghania sp.]
MDLPKLKYTDRLSESEALYVSSVFNGLAKDIMRLSRGSGDVTSFVDSLMKATKVFDSLSEIPYGDWAYYLNGLGRWEDIPTGDRFFLEKNAINMICRGALQIVATRLAGNNQGGTEGKGLSQLHEGIKMLEAAKHAPLP